MEAFQAERLEKSPRTVQATPKVIYVDAERKVYAPALSIFLPPCSRTDTLLGRDYRPQLNSGINLPRTAEETCDFGITLTYVNRSAEMAEDVAKGRSRSMGYDQFLLYDREGEGGTERRIKGPVPATPEGGGWVVTKMSLTHKMHVGYLADRKAHFRADEKAEQEARRLLDLAAEKGIGRSSEQLVRLSEQPGGSEEDLLLDDAAIAREAARQRKRDKPEDDEENICALRDMCSRQKAYVDYMAFQPKGKEPMGAGRDGGGDGDEEEDSDEQWTGSGTRYSTLPNGIEKALQCFVVQTPQNILAFLNYPEALHIDDTACANRHNRPWWAVTTHLPTGNAVTVAAGVTLGKGRKDVEYILQAMDRNVRYISLHCISTTSTYYDHLYDSRLS